MLGLHRAAGANPANKLRGNKLKPEISLSPKAIAIINEQLTHGNRVQVDYNPKTGELAIYRVPRMETKYRVVVTAG